MNVRDGAIDSRYLLNCAWGKDMPFSSLAPEDIARTRAALDAAWDEVKSTVPDGLEEQERTRLAYIIASFVAVAEDEEDLAQRAIERYRNSPR